MMNRSDKSGSTTGRMIGSLEDYQLTCGPITRRSIKMATIPTQQTNTEDGRMPTKLKMIVSLVDPPKILFDSEPEGEETNTDACSD